MKRKIYPDRRRKTFFVALVMIAFALVMFVGNSATASAKPADAYTIDWYTMDGGGTMNASGGTFTLSGTIGQADAGMMSSGAYTLGGGFWGSMPADVIKFYLPLILKNP